ncbi:uncharacterized protein [Phaseolus vulgaris]|uniref:uncharacterized protein n=1 Tax=Phaseolus vulgaris TaxID=3885 RepID=UPI0035C9DD9E
MIPYPLYIHPKHGSSVWNYPERLVDEHIVFWNCSHPVTGNPKYVDTRGCLNWKWKGYIYAVAGDLIAEDIEVGCEVKLVSPTSWRGLDTNTYSYDMMHTALLYGFELSWIPLACEDRCSDIDCYFSSSSHTLQCYNEKRRGHSSNLNLYIFRRPPRWLMKFLGKNSTSLDCLCLNW